jgi:hypothetical protein
MSDDSSTLPHPDPDPDPDISSSPILQISSRPNNFTEFNRTYSIPWSVCGRMNSKMS